MTTCIIFITEALGDNIAFSPYADLYQKKYGGKVFVKTKWHNILQSNNENVHFINKSENISYDKIFEINFHFKNCPIQKLICDQLGIDYEEIIPSIKNFDKYKFKKKKKYVCIGIQSTCQMKYWNNNSGWNKTIKYLKDNGYDVYAIDKDKIFGISGHWNHIPQKAFNETGNYPIEYRIEQLKNCEFFIGLSSGLSWLAWALNKKVVMISGCTQENNEFISNNYRVINKNVCHGCLNDESINNKDRILSEGWLYCPNNKKFECSKEISFDMVKQKIDQCINELKMNS
jgi:autotransporter strand-loop-strand O-heptosyltransferase